MEQDIRRTKTCERCKANIGFDQVKYLPSKSPNGLMVVCAKCVEEIKNANSGNPVKNAKPAAAKAETKKPSDGKTEFFCGRCNYKFKVDEARLGYTLNLKCPYCGKYDRVSKR